MATSAETGLEHGASKRMRCQGPSGLTAPNGEDQSTVDTQVPLQLDGQVEYLASASARETQASSDSAWIVEETSDKELLRTFLRMNPQIHAYALGDLADPLWQHCRWHILRGNSDGNEGIHAVSLTFGALQTPVVQVLANPREARSLHAAASLLNAMVIHDLLPSGAFECHLNVGLEALLQRAGGLAVKARAHLRMALEEGCSLVAPTPVPVIAVNSSDSIQASVKRLISADARIAAELCATMPRTWFEPRVLEEGRYFGIERVGTSGLVSIGGTHVFAPSDGVAALGNICTHPDFQGRGLGKYVVHSLCDHLRSEGVRVIALNVETDNQPALRMYTSLGFSTVMEFVECDVQRCQAS